MKRSLFPFLFCHSFYFGKVASLPSDLGLIKELTPIKCPRDWGLVPKIHIDKLLLSFDVSFFPSWSDLFNPSSESKFSFLWIWNYYGSLIKHIKCWGNIILFYGRAYVVFQHFSYSAFCTLWLWVKQTTWRALIMIQTFVADVYCSLEKSLFLRNPHFVFKKSLNMTVKKF